MSIKFSKKRSDLPEYILLRLDNYNLYYSAEYENYLIINHIDYSYYYNNAFVIIVQSNLIAKIFKQAILVSEPCPLGSEFSIDQIGDFDAEEKQFLDDVIEELTKQSVHWISVTTAGAMFKSYPSSSIRIPWGNYIINLKQENSTLFSNMHSKHRNMIRRGEKSNIEVRFGGVELLEDYLKLDKETWGRSNTEIDNTNLYSNLLSSFSNQSIIGIAYKDSIPQAAIFGLYNSEMFYYQYGASTNRPVPGSTHYLQWRMMLYMKEMGVRNYNFVGCRINVDEDSKLKNIQHFKEGFGGTMKLSYTFKVNINKFMSSLFLFLFKLRWNRTKSDVVDQELSKWLELNNCIDEKTQNRYTYFS